MNSRANELIDNLSFTKSNEFIAAKFKSSLLENQLIAISMTRIQAIAEGNETKLHAKLYPGELKRLVSDPAHITRDLAKASKNMVGHTIFIEDGNGNFRVFSMVTNVDYIDGVLDITFNDILLPHVLKLEKNYTVLELSVMVDFKRNSSFRLYEILKKDAYKILKNGVVQVEYNISELKFMLGLANMDSPEIKKALAGKSDDIDWDQLYAKLDKKEKSYEKWPEFRRNIIEPAQEELVEKSDIKFEYEGVKDGKAFKRIIFTIAKNDPQNVESLNEKQKILGNSTKKENYQLRFPRDMYPDLYSRFVGHNGLTEEDIDLLIKKSDNNVELIEKAIEYTDSREWVDNYMGYILKCIENGGYQTTEVSYGSKESADIFNEIKAETEKLKTNDLVQKKLYERIKLKPDFKDFEDFLEINGLSVEKIELIYPISEIVTMYFDYITGRGVTF